MAPQAVREVSVPVLQETGEVGTSRAWKANVTENVAVVGVRQSYLNADYANVSAMAGEACLQPRGEG